MNVTVIVATHGDEAWRELAWSRAYPSVLRQTVAPFSHIVHHSPKGTLAEARNAAAAHVAADWLCFLDADDELHPEYLETMIGHWRDLASDYWKATGERNHPWVLLAPAVQYVRPDGTETTPELPNRQAPMHVLNHCVIGTLIPTRLFHKVGGFREWPAYEDWDLFLRCAKHGPAVIVDVPGAVYRAFTHPGRNSQPREVLEAAYKQIRREHQKRVA
jgi:glycosyltransferase involved in cell wall biosynthesis